VRGWRRKSKNERKLGERNVKKRRLGKRKKKRKRRQALPVGVVATLTLVSVRG